MSEDFTDLMLGPGNAPAAPAPNPGLDNIVNAVTSGAGIPPPPPPPAENNGAGGNGGNNAGGGGGSGAGAAATTDQHAANGVENSAANSAAGFGNSQGNLDDLKATIERLGPTLDTPEGQQQLMAALQRYLQAGGGQMRATDGSAQAQAGDLQSLLDQLQNGDKKSHSKDDSKDDSKDSKDDSSKDDSKDKGPSASDLKDLLGSLGPALQGLNPFGQQSPFGGQSPFGQQSPFGPESPFGQQSPFGPNAGGVTPASNPFASVPAAGGGAPAGTPGGGGLPTTTSPFEALKTEGQGGDQPGQPGEKKEEGKDDPNSLTVTAPDGTQIQASSPEMAKALRASFTSDDDAANYTAAGIDIKSNPGTQIDPSQVQPGDYEMVDGRPEIAVGPGKVVSNGQVVAANTDPDDGFTGWYRPSAGGGGGGSQQSESSSSPGTVTASKEQQ